MKRVWKTGLLIFMMVSMIGCAEDVSKTQILPETSEAETETKAAEAEETSEAQTESQSKDEQIDSKWADSGEDRFIEGYDVTEKKVTLSLSDAAFPHCYLSDGRLGKVLGEQGRMLYLEGFHDIQSGETSVCRVSAEEGGEAEVLFELEPYEFMREIGMIGDHFYFLYVSMDDGLAKSELYEYGMDGKYQILDSWTAPYAAEYWIVDHDLACSVVWEDRCELWVYDLTSGEKKLVETTECVINEDKIMTGVIILFGGALDGRGFCYETAELENEYVYSATKYNTYYYDLETGESRYLYSPQHQPLFLRGDDQFLLSTETTYETPLKDPTAIYNAGTGEWGRIAIPGVDTGWGISEVKKIEEGKYLFGNYHGVGVFELENKSMTWYAISVDDFPEEWIPEGLTADAMTYVYLTGSKEEVLCVNCVNECILIRLSDLQKAGR